MIEIKMLLMSVMFTIPVHAQQPVLNSSQGFTPASHPARAEATWTTDGSVKEYYPNGKLAFMQSMKDGNIEGEVVAYYEDGSLKGRTHYIKNYQDGLSQEFYQGGGIKEEVTYIDGQMMELKQFDKHGKMVFQQKGKFNFGCAVIK